MFGELIGDLGELASNDTWILQVVSLGKGGGILVPVGERWRIFLEHSTEPQVEKYEDIPHMTGIFKRGPYIWKLTLPHLWMNKYRFPLGGDIAQCCRG